MIYSICHNRKKDDHNFCFMLTNDLVAEVNYHRTKIYISACLLAHISYEYIWLMKITLFFLKLLIPFCVIAWINKQYLLLLLLLL